jgi:hypothetical protein
VGTPWGSGHTLGQWAHPGAVGTPWGSGHTLGQWAHPGAVGTPWGSGHTLGQLQLKATPLQLRGHGRQVDALQSFLKQRRKWLERLIGGPLRARQNL